MLRLEKIMMSVLSGLNDIALYPDLNNRTTCHLQIVCSVRQVC
jgi:hypothetical protein